MCWVDKEGERRDWMWEMWKPSRYELRSAEGVGREKGGQSLGAFTKELTGSEAP